MRVTSHPQYQLHLQRLARYERLRQAVTRWRATGTPLVVDRAEPDGPLVWSGPDAVRLAQAVGQALIEHNRIIWQDFPFCRRCGGLCCADRSAYYDDDVFGDEISLLLLTLLDLPAVTLPDEIPVAPADCIYRAPQGCMWSPVGRPWPCALFYCDGAEGGGRQDTPEAQEEYERLVDTLEAALIVRLRHTAVGEVFCRLEPDATEDDAGSLFWDPEDVAGDLQSAIEQVFLAAFRARFLAGGG